MLAYERPTKLCLHLFACIGHICIPMTVRSTCKNETFIFKAISRSSSQYSIEWNLISLFYLALVSWLMKTKWISNPFVWVNYTVVPRQSIIYWYFTSLDLPCLFFTKAKHHNPGKIPAEIVKSITALYAAVRTLHHGNYSCTSMYSLQSVHQCMHDLARRCSTQLSGSDVFPFLWQKSLEMVSSRLSEIFLCRSA